MPPSSPRIDSQTVLRPVRILAVTAILVALLAVGGGVAGARTAEQRRATFASRLTAGLLRDINELRAAHGLAPLRVSPDLTEAAEEHSQEMATAGYFAHESRDGTAFWKRLQRFYRPRGRRWQVGENLAWASPGLSSSSAIRMWMRSPGHRANLLRPSWREIGLAAVRQTAAPGLYGGLRVTIVTADFGARG